MTPRIPGDLDQSRMVQKGLVWHHKGLNVQEPNSYMAYHSYTSQKTTQLLIEIMERYPSMGDGLCGTSPDCLKDCTGFNVILEVSGTELHHISIMRSTTFAIAWELLILYSNSARLHTWRVFSPTSQVGCHDLLAVFQSRLANFTDLSFIYACNTHNT